MPGVKKDISKTLGEVDASGAVEGAGKSFSAGFVRTTAGVITAVTSKAIGLLADSINGAIACGDTG